MGIQQESAGRVVFYFVRICSAEWQLLQDEISVPDGCPDEEKPKEIVNDVPIKGNFEKLVYKVHPGGEDLTALCTYYNCNKYVIMKWNDLLDDELIEGTEIKLYVTKSH